MALDSQQQQPRHHDSLELRARGGWLSEALRFVGPYLLAGALGAGAFGAGAGVRASDAPQQQGCETCEARLRAVEASLASLDRKLSVALCRVDRKLCEL